MQIDDDLLLNNIIKICDRVNSEAYLKENGIENSVPFLQHPLDKDIKKELESIKGKCSTAVEGREVIELSYAMNSDINKLWCRLIEKSIICLRYFDKREPFMKNGKIPFAYGLDDTSDSLNEYHNKYIDFEGVLYGSDTYYRDHVFHVVRVWMLGIFLLMDDNTFINGKDGKTLIEMIHFEGDSPKEPFADIKKYEKKLKKSSTGSICVKEHAQYYKICKGKDGEYEKFSVNNFSGEINSLEKFSMWTIMALCHDLGYPLEKSKKILEKTEEMMAAFVSRPNIKGDLHFDGTRDSNNKDIILFTSKKMKALGKKRKKIIYKASIQEKYKFKYMLSLEAFAHGVISAIIIYKKLNYFKETDNNTNPDYEFEEEDARQFYIRRDILRAMASHTCPDIYHIDMATFPMFLFVCDELQEWGRKSWKNMYKGIKDNAVELSIESFNSEEIKYRETINMSNADTEQIVDNIKRIWKHQYMKYKATFRDGQDTAKRKFDYIKNIVIKVNKDYQSIKQINIELCINHDKDSVFVLVVEDSGYKNDDNPRYNAGELCKKLAKFIEPFEKDRKYGECKMMGKKGEEK